jgi:LacI family transcriptional regulator
MPNNKTDRKSVALLVETASQYGRQLLTGILRYRTEVANWRVVIDERDMNTSPEWFEKWSGDGVICRITTPKIARRAMERRLAFVDLTDRKEDFPSFVTMRANDELIGDLAAKHFMKRGFQSFAFFGIENVAWSVRRRNSFVKRLREQGHDCHVLEWQFEHLNVDQQELADWLIGLPKPVGIFCGNDARAKFVIDTCVSNAIEVPEQVAVLGVDNDELLCNFCEPTLSSIIPNAEETGYQSAAALDRLMNGDPVNRIVRLTPPLDIRLRQSTDTMAIDDIELAKALAFIRNRACEGITVDDVLAETTMSRSSFERRTRRYLGVSPQQQIRQAQLKQVKYLLAETEMLIEAIGTQCGFDHPEYLHVIFKREFDMTPGEYRKLARRK